MKKVSDNTYELEPHEVELLKNKQGGRWKPLDNQTYHLVDINGDVIFSRWRDSDTDLWNYSQRNCFATREEAQADKKYLEAVAEVRDSAGDYVPVWDGEAHNWCVYYDTGSKTLKVDFTKFCQYIEIAYFPSEEAAQKSIDEHKDAWLCVFGRGEK